MARGRKIGIPYGSNPETCPVRVLQTMVGTAKRNFRATISARSNRHGAITGTQALTGYCCAKTVKKARRACGVGSGEVRGAFSPSWARHQRSHCRSVGTLDHETKPGIGPVQMVRRYIRDGNLFRENSGGKLGL